MNGHATHDHIGVCARALELCGVREGEHVTVLSSGATLRDHAVAFLEAARRLGADACELRLDPATPTDATDRVTDFGRSPLAHDARAREALARPGLVVDLWVASFSPECEAIQRAGARVLLVGEAPEVLARMFPSPELRARTQRDHDRLARARTLTIRSESGTDITYRFAANAPFRPLLQYGFVDEPGRWDHFPSGLVARFTPDVEGTIVMAAGDMLLPHMRLVSTPITFEIRAGRVATIRGGDDAAALRAYIEAYGDRRAYEVSHIGWGTHPKAEWTVQGMGMDGRSFLGGVLFSLGPNLEFGGANDTACHLDLPLRGCTLRVDDTLVIDRGRYVLDDPSDVAAK